MACPPLTYAWGERAAASRQRARCRNVRGYSGNPPVNALLPAWRTCLATTLANPRPVRAATRAVGISMRAPASCRSGGRHWGRVLNGAHVTLCAHGRGYTYQRE
ncbi:hypothetical protein EON67_12015 [archaeon]|nr:MAG: hypothetical protein EON67_12015 [archaeon]